MNQAHQRITRIVVRVCGSGLALLLLAGCAASESPARWRMGASHDEALREEFAASKALAAPPASAPGGAQMFERVALQTPAPPQPAGDKRIVVYTARYRLVVREIESAIAETEKLAAEFGGWVQAIQGDSITFRVPADRYEQATERVEALGRVSERDLQAADVTEEYVDLEARLKNAQAVRQRLLTLLDKAENVTAALEVEKELGRIGQEIEQLQGKLELLKNRVAYSTITATFERVFRTPPARQLVRLPFDWLQELDPNRLVEPY